MTLSISGHLLPPFMENPGLTRSPPTRWLTLKIRVPCTRARVQTSSILDLSRFVPLKMKRRGVETRIIIAAGNERTTAQVGSALFAVR